MRASVSKTCLVRIDNNRCSVTASAVGRPVEIRAYAERIELRQDGRVVGEHPRAFGRGETVCDPRRYVPVLARKPWALRNGAPFKDWELPASLERVRRKLRRVADGDRQMVGILGAALTDGPPAVEAACAEIRASAFDARSQRVGVRHGRRERLSGSSRRARVKDTVVSPASSRLPTRRSFPLAPQGQPARTATVSPEAPVFATRRGTQFARNSLAEDFRDIRKLLFPGDTRRLQDMRRTCVPTLSPGDVVVMDNLGSRKSQAVRRAIRQAGAHLLFLPPYSPDLNPIEQAFSKLKHRIRKAAARTRGTLWRTVGAILDSFTPQECANYLKNAGYASVKP